MPFCKECRDWYYSYNHHDCCIWIITCPELDIDERQRCTQHAISAYDAVLKWIEEYEACNLEFHCASNGETLIISAAKPDDPSTKKTFKVTGEIVPEYYANEVEDE